MKRTFALFLSILALAAFQASFLAPWFSGYFSPDALLAALMAGTMIFGFQRIWGAVIVSGLAMDLFSYARLGSHVVIFILAVYLISFISRRFSIGESVPGMALALGWVAVATGLENWGSLVLENGRSQGFFLSSALAQSFGFSVLANIGFFFASYSVLSKIKKYYYPAGPRFAK